MEKVYQTIASTLDAYHNCIKSNNTEWEAKHLEILQDIEKNILPSGSGIDTGTKINMNKSNGNKIVLSLAYHHMNEQGSYDGWTEHELTIKPHLYLDFTIDISGRNKNDIKTYLTDIFNEILVQEFNGIN